MKLKNTAVALICLLCAAALAGCEYVPSEVFEVKTTDGKTLKLLCPVIDPNRNTLTYFRDNECMAIRD